MDHNEAVRLQAAVKYVLGELPEALRNAYEEHFFTCPECALDLKAAAAFVDSAREALRHEPAKSPSGEALSVRGAWFTWFRPVVAVPAFAVLLLFVIYQNAVTIPRAREEASRGMAQLFTASYSLQMANTRGGEEVTLQVPAKESFALKFDFTPSQSFNRYLCRLLDSSGHAVLEASVPGSSANKEMQLAIPAGLVKPGKYTLVFTAPPDAAGPSSRAEVLRLSFAIEFPR